MSYSLTPGLNTMGIVHKEESTKDAGLFFQPMPGSDSSSAIQLDIFGATRTITIEGTYSASDSSYANIAAFIAALDALVNGSQTTRTYVSGKSGVTYNVLVASATWNANQAEEGSVEYHLTLQEGGT